VKYLTEQIEATEIKAETLVAQMDVKENLIVRMRGVFARNYGEDLIGVSHDRDTTTLYLSRNGVFHILPEGLFFEENRLRTTRGEYFEGKYDKFKKEAEKVKAFFQIFDTEYFKQSFDLEQKQNAITERGNTVLINPCLNKPEMDTRNEYLEKLQTLLPFVSQLRGNFVLLPNMLKEILSVEKVEIRHTKPLYMQFILHKSGLSKEEFWEMDRDFAEFFDFFYRWFLPIEIEYDYKIKSYTAPFILGDTLILDYNTHL